MTNAELAILSLIAEKPRHGYQIEQVIQDRGMRDWTEVGFSSIYYLLKKMEKNGLIEGRVERHAGQGPARKVYHITRAGRSEWHNAALDALSIPCRCYPTFQLGLANLPGISEHESLPALRLYCDQLIQRREHVRQRQDRIEKPRPRHIDAMFDLSLTMVDAELAWVKKFMQRLQSEISTATRLDPGQMSEKV